jgi:hypothetical protein
MRAIWLCGALLLAAAPAFGQPSAQMLKQMCAQVPCRKVATLTLRRADGGTGQVDTNAYPYLDPNGNVILYPGETISIAVKANGSGKPRLLKVADAAGMHQFAEATAGEKTLIFQLKQMNDKPDMVLTASNTTTAVIKYDVVITAATDKGIKQGPTSTCPLSAPSKGAPDFRGVESWPYPIFEMLIHDIRPLGKSTPRACE